MSYQNKQVAVIGAGRSGTAAAVLLVGLGAHVTLVDSHKQPSDVAGKLEMLKGMGVAVHFDEDFQDLRLGQFDFAVLSPGIDPKLDLVQSFLRTGVPVTAEVELAYSCCSRPIIGVSGSNGKTTTTELITAMLTAAGVRTIAGGNIGKPFSEIVTEGSDQYDIVTLEVSSFQLERIRRFRPTISVWLNLAPDHLDRYPKFEDYRGAKLRLFENQTAENFAVVNFRDNLPATHHLLSLSNRRRFRPSGRCHSLQGLTGAGSTPYRTPRQAQLRKSHGRLGCWPGAWTHAGEDERGAVQLQTSSPPLRVGPRAARRALHQ